MGARWRRVCTACLLLVPGLSSVGADDGNENLNLPHAGVRLTRDEEGVLRLEVNRASWDQVFAEIAGRAGVQVHHAGLPPVLVSASCVGPSIKDVVECLLGPKASLVFRYSAELSQGVHKAQPVEAWVGMSTPDTGQCIAGEAPEQTQTLQAADSRVKAHSTVPDPELTETLERLAESDKPADRISALSQLAGDKPVAPAMVDRIVENGVADEDPNVR